MHIALLVALSVLPPPQQGAKGQQAAQVLTNDSIVRLVNAGLAEDTILSIVNTQPGKYSLSPDDVIALKKAGVPERVTAAMAGESSKSMWLAPDRLLQSQPTLLATGTPLGIGWQRRCKFEPCMEFSAGLQGSHPHHSAGQGNGRSLEKDKVHMLSWRDG